MYFLNWAIKIWEYFVTSEPHFCVEESWFGSWYETLAQGDNVDFA
jgi:hypothetical protein